MTRQEIFEQASRVLKTEFEALRATYTHPGAKGTEFEKILISFLLKKLPKRYNIVSGFILDKKDVVSTQQDIIIYDALNAPLYSVDDQNSVVPNDNVATTIEVKANLTTKDLRECFAKTESLKSLFKTLDDKAVPRNKDTYYDTQNFIFAFSSEISLKKIAEIYLEETRRRVSKGLQVDGVFVLDKGFVSLAVLLPNNEFGPLFIAHNALNVSKAKVYVKVQEFKEKTLDYFLRIILPHLAMFYQRVDHPGFEWELEFTPSEDLLLYEVPANEPGRNDMCFCTSEKKYKYCCGSGI